MYYCYCFTLGVNNPEGLKQCNAMQISWNIPHSGRASNVYDRFGRRVNLILALSTLPHPSSQMWHSVWSSRSRYNTNVQGSKGRRSKSQRNVMYQQQNAMRQERIDWPTLNLTWVSQLKWRTTDAATCGFMLQCISAATFSGYYFLPSVYIYETYYGPSRVVLCARTIRCATIFIAFTKSPFSRHRGASDRCCTAIHGPDRWSQFRPESGLL